MKNKVSFPPLPGWETTTAFQALCTSQRVRKENLRVCSALMEAALFFTSI